jgi:hypothetical protein
VGPVSSLEKSVGARYAELGFLHLMISAGHIVHSGESGRETSTYYFSCSGGTGTDCTKSASEHVTLNMCFAFQCIRGAKCRGAIFHAWVEPVMTHQKVHRNTLC